MEVQEHHCQDSQRHLYKHCPVATLTTQYPTPDFLAADSGPSTDVTLTDRTAPLETRCNTGPTHQEDVLLEAAHHPSTACSRQHGDADQEAAATHRTQQHGSTHLRSMDGLFHTSLHPLVTHQDVTATDPTAVSREWMHLHSTLESARQARTCLPTEPSRL